MIATGCQRAENDFARQLVGLKTEEQREQFAKEHSGQRISLAGTILDVRGTARVFLVVETPETKAAQGHGFEIAVTVDEKTYTGVAARLDAGELVLQQSNGRSVTVKKGQRVKLKAIVWDYQKGEAIREGSIPGRLRIDSAVIVN